MTSSTSNKRIVIIAEPNGAGKTTFAKIKGVSIAIILHWMRDVSAFDAQ
ncbi:hypothetical protein GALL_262490 [mine drainage metagenome]|uniref:Uncharacterized protein n=1 Tax=mine drainage metagenome TaxID=410659 RepID=A0A1J5R7B4_9ZZZZ